MSEDEKKMLSGTLVYEEGSASHHENDPTSEAQEYY